jgi:hypothetical protein
MPKGDSGRVVIEVDPDLKRKLYSILAIDNSTLKEWFVRAVKSFIAEHEQPRLPELNKKQGRAKKS